MRKTKILCLLLVLAMLASLLIACDDEGVVNDGGDRVNGSWEGVDFKGQTVKFSISKNQCSECTFPASTVYSPTVTTTLKISFFKQSS